MKFYGWELSFKKLVEKIRDKELRVLVRMNVLQTIISFFFGASSFLVWRKKILELFFIKFGFKSPYIVKIATASFIAFILIDEKNDLDASTAFVSLTLFNMIRFPLLMLPQVITSVIQVKWCLHFYCI